MTSPIWPWPTAISRKSTCRITMLALALRLKTRQVLLCRSLSRQSYAILCACRAGASCAGTIQFRTTIWSCNCRRASSVITMSRPGCGCMNTQMTQWLSSMAPAKLLHIQNKERLSPGRKPKKQREPFRRESIDEQASSRLRLLTACPSMLKTEADN